ncbi:MAG: MFS transporter [Propionibacteriaceae bacterium]|nr:MFS transporter [Propionibacteriaceae bacterium]
MLQALRNRTYRHLYLAQIVALLGTGLATVALGLLAYNLAGDAAGLVLGTALAIKMVAYVLIAPLAAALVSHLSRKAVLIGADALRLIVALCLPFVGEVWQVYLLIFILQASSATFTPTFQSVIPDVLPDEEEYTAALSLSRLAYDLESVLSPMLAAALLLIMDSATLFFGTAAGFAGSILLVLSVLIPRRPSVDGGLDQAPFGQRLQRGMALFIRQPALRPVIALNLVPASAVAFVIVQTVVVVRSTFGLPEQVVAWVLGINGLGSMIAAIALPRVLRTIPERTVMLGGAILLSAASALIPLALTAGHLTAGIAWVMALWLVIGLGWSAVETPIGRIIRRNVDRHDLPTAFAAQFSLQHACWLITYPLAGWLGSITLAGTAWVLAAIAAAATITAAIIWPRSKTTTL